MPRDFESGSLCGPQRDGLPGLANGMENGVNRVRDGPTQTAGRMPDKDVPSITSREKHLNRNSGALVYAPTSSILFQYALARQARYVNAKVNVDDDE